MNNSVKRCGVKSIVVRYIKEVRAEIAGAEFKSADDDICNAMACDNLTDAMHFTRAGEYSDAITLLTMAQEMISVITYPNDDEVNKSILYEKLAYAHGFLAKLYTNTL